MGLNRLMTMVKRILVKVLFVAPLLVSGCSQESSQVMQVVPSENNSIIEVDKLDSAKALISDLFYQDQIASGKGFDEFLDFQINNSYPGSLNIEVARKCARDSQTLIPYGVPDLDTVRADPNWVVPITSEADIDLGGPPKGDTYILTAENVAGKSQIHVTILDGKAYYFPYFCF